MPTFTISSNSAAKWSLPQFNSPHNSRSSPIILRQSLLHVGAFRIHCVPPEPLLPLPKITHDQPSFGGGGGGVGDAGGDGGGGDGDRDGGGDEEFGPLLNFEAVMRESEARGVKLPPDMVEAARVTGIREMFLLRYLELQSSSWPLSFLMQHCSMLRNRMLADPSFLFKVGTEIVIDSCCATFAEVQKRGKDFWAEFELYAADLLVGVVVDIALVGMLAPYARIGKPSLSKGLLGQIQQACSALPSRSIKKSEDDIPVPPLLQSAALWGFFLTVSSNTRYQIINGLESLVEASVVAKRVPLVAMAFTVGVRFGNNIYGGMQFVDWAKRSGVQ
ncbi:Protein RETICULATA-RELATED 1 [Vigna angularis]|uniref:Protein RETICULATA-RELATED 1 n=1 Tax=Phaseolus angularis TaxID=3914 RepID=A0A8T0JE87_PHAAN|nr:Protein RETICULATA-RELATED 1 [Vigna angularis]